MTPLQNIVLKLIPRSWAQSLESESRAWKIICRCGYEKSVWDWGGIRWKATGQPRKYLRCPHCGQASWHITTFKPDTQTAASTEAPRRQV